MHIATFGGYYVKKQNSDFLREEVLQQTEDLLDKACQKGKMCGLSIEELKEMLELVYGGETDE